MLFQFYGGGVFQTFERWGMFDALLPFALVFTVVYGILRKIKIFGESASNRLDIIIALVTASAFVYPHLSGRYNQWGVADPVNIINESIPQVGVIIIAIVMFLIMIGLLGFKKFGVLQQGMVFLSFLLVGYIFLNAAGYLTLSWLSFMNNPDLQAFLVIVLVLGGLLFFLSEGPPSSEGPLSGLKKIFKDLVGENP